MQIKPRMNTESKQIIWGRWQEGHSLSNIGREIERAPASVFGYLRIYGGIRPRQRTRSRMALSPAEREEISRGLSSGTSIRGIADLLRRSPSTISREINRNGGTNNYRAAASDSSAWERANPDISSGKGIKG